MIYKKKKSLSEFYFVIFVKLAAQRPSGLAAKKFNVIEMLF
jgi:hypothetical protein